MSKQEPTWMINIVPGSEPNDQNLSYFEASWVVPALPKAPQPADSVFYLWIGVNQVEQEGLVQPVLQLETINGQPQWQMQNYAVLTTGQVPQKWMEPGSAVTAVNVNVGDTITAAVEPDNANETMKYGFQVNGGDWNWATVNFAGQNIMPLNNPRIVLETMNLTSCDQYPSGQTTFKDMKVEYGGSAIDFVWATGIQDPSVSGCSTLAVTYEDATGIPVANGGDMTIVY